jgi:hypothetical protein
MAAAVATRFFFVSGFDMPGNSAALRNFGDFDFLSAESTAASPSAAACALTCFSS